MWKSGRSGLSKYENGRLIKRRIRCSLDDDNGSSCRFLKISSFKSSVDHWFDPDLSGRTTRLCPKITLEEWWCRIRLNLKWNKILFNLGGEIYHINKLTVMSQMPVLCIDGLWDIPEKSNNFLVWTLSWSAWFFKRAYF